MPARVCLQDIMASLPGLEMERRIVLVLRLPVSEESSQAGEHHGSRMVLTVR